MDCPIFLIHGLGGHPNGLLPLELYLNYVGFTYTHMLSWPIDNTSFEDILDHIDNEIGKYAEKEQQEIVLIGHSMGGVISNQMHTKGWRVKNAIYIGSPLHGANLLNQILSVLPTRLVNVMRRTLYDFLQDKDQMEKYAKEPPHTYKTISMGWCTIEFSGCVYKN